MEEKKVDMWGIFYTLDRRQYVEVFIDLPNAKDRIANMALQGTCKNIRLAELKNGAKFPMPSR